MATQSIILGIGTGHCGLASLAKALNQQRDAVCSFDESPLLPWTHTDGQQTIRERFARFRLHAIARLLGDCASFYLPYIEDAIAAEPDIRIVCLKKSTGRGGCEFLSVARSDHAAADEPLGPKAHPRLAS